MTAFHQKFERMLQLEEDISSSPLGIRVVQAGGKPTIEKVEQSQIQTLIDLP
jgi:hypothetical protein